MLPNCWFEVLLECRLDNCARLFSKRKISIKNCFMFFFYLELKEILKILNLGNPCTLNDSALINKDVVLMMIRIIYI